MLAMGRNGGMGGSRLETGVLIFAFLRTRFCDFKYPQSQEEFDLDTKRDLG